MENNSSNYVLDFVIPRGEKGNTGPTGPQGATGPTGPTMVKAILSLDYNNSSSAGILSIKEGSNKVLLPNNSNYFSYTTDAITLNESGFYEFSVYGSLIETTTQEGAKVIVKVGESNLVSIVLDAEQRELYFSRTMFKQCQTTDKVIISLDKASTSSASTNNVYLIIKQFSIGN